MTRIFISYRRDDTGYIASMLADKLAATFGNDSVFLDVDNIPMGVDFRSHIDSAVARCDVFVALIGDHWLDVQTSDGTRRLDDPTDFVRIELESALRRDIPIIPVLSEGATMPRESDLPSTLAPFAFRNAAELRSGKNLRFHMDALLKGIQGLVPAKRPAAKPTPKDERLPILAAASEPIRRPSPPLKPTRPTNQPRPATGNPRTVSPRKTPFQPLFRRIFLLYWPRSLVARTLHVLFYVMQCIAFAGAIWCAVDVGGSQPVFLFLIAWAMYSTPGYVLFWLPAFLADKWDES
ncbi:MAG: TIR domain-containing protein [Planctomycetaceae bacterium]